jgi:uncharacterized membrane protein
LLVSRREHARPESEVHGVYRYGRCDETGPLAVSWATAFRLRQSARGSLWVLPLVGGLLGVLLGSGLIWADRSVRLPPYWTYSPSTASTVLSAIVGAMAALTGFVVTVTGMFEPAGEQPALVIRSARPGAIQALDVRGLAGWARGHGCLVVLCRRVGDFVPAGAALIETYGGAPGIRAERTLRNMIVLGDERTIDQDPAFAIRIIVDIADKALSPAVNDPTTAVQALDHLSDVLRLIGTTDLSRSQWHADHAVRTGLVIPARSWQDYLTLGVTEIREYGATAIQVMRRMRAMLEELRDEVRTEYRPPVEDELARLETTVARAFADSVDLDRANTADPQGIGGRTEPPGPSTITG